MNGGFDRLDDGSPSLGERFAAALQSPPTWSAPVALDDLARALELFGLHRDDLDSRVPPARIHGGADHLVRMLASRARLATMAYDFTRGQAMMRANGWVTVLLGGWPHGGAIEISQGNDMGVPSRIRAEISATPGASIRVSGTARTP